jgi:hypothetical protein
MADHVVEERPGYLTEYFYGWDHDGIFSLRRRTPQQIMGYHDGDIFVYMGGRAPPNVTRVRIDKSVDVIEEDAFMHCRHLVYIETHDGIKRVGSYAFGRCELLRWIHLKSVVEIGVNAFCGCKNLKFVKFDKLETIRYCAFEECSSLTHLKLPSIITIEAGAFYNCKALTDIEFSERLDKIESGAFSGCGRLQRIAIPLKRNLFAFLDEEADDPPIICFNHFEQLLRTVDLVGEAHTKTVASLHMESWRTEMIARINRINGVLPTNSANSLWLSDIPADDKSEVIQQWMDSVMRKLYHFKAEHYRYVKEAITLLELALWKARLEETEENDDEGRTEETKTGDECARRERRIISGAGIVIKNVLPFLQLS